MGVYDVEDSSGLILVRDHVRREQDDRPLRRGRDAGTLLRVRRGAYADSKRWESLTSADRYRARVIAVVGTRRRMPVVGYESAAALWGYPRFAQWPNVVHVVAGKSSAVRSKNGVSVHRDDLDQRDVVELDGVLITSPERTLVDVARTAPFRESVAAIDRALNPARSAAGTTTTRAALLATLEAGSSVRGRRLAAKAIAFSDGRADNPGESVSRVAIFELGFPAPDLQRRHANPRGGFYFTDFEWPDFATIGEFDGRGKYLKNLTPGSGYAGEAVYEEKLREDHLRAEGNAFARWGHLDVLDPARLRTILLRTGLPLLRRA